MDRVLLIDDDAGLILEQVRQALSHPCYDVHCAETGSDGIASVRADAPDVILLDLRLPDVSGLAVFEAIREIDARIPVIFVTTSKTADTAIEAMRQGAFDYLHKPLDLERLQHVVGEALEVARRMRSPVRIADSTCAGKDPTITLPDLDAYIRDQMTRDTNDVYTETYRHVDKLLLVRALEHTGGNQRDAARLLGISRQTMRSRLRSLGLMANHALEIEGETR